jgi:DNA polymerase III epsilon subunit-like protein
MIKVKHNVFVAIDIETTGLESKDEILEIGAIKFSLNGKRIASYERRFRPRSGMIPPEATAIHGIKFEDVQSCKHYDEASSAIKSMCEATPIVGHNVQFDLSFLKFGYVNIPCVYDTMDMGSDIWNSKRLSLKKACEFAEIDFNETKHHGAMYDAKMSMKLFLWLQKPTRGQTEIELKFEEKEKPVIVSVPIVVNKDTAPVDLNWSNEMPSIHNGNLVIPFGCDKKYHWWCGGQTADETMAELSK